MHFHFLRVGGIQGTTINQIVKWLVGTFIYFCQQLYSFDLLEVNTCSVIKDGCGD